MPGAMFTKQAVRTLVVLATALLLTGPAVLPALAQGTASASMIEDSPNHFAFRPGAMSVAAGTTVTWTNKSAAPHTVTSDTGAFGSSPVAPSTAFRFTFSQAGTFNYHCSIHPYMHGTITVTTGAASHATAAATPVPVPGTMPATGAGGTAGQTTAAALAVLLGSLLLGAAGGFMAAVRRGR